MVVGIQTISDSFSLPELTRAVNQGLRNTVWETEAITDSLNSYNHIHFNLTVVPTQIPTCINETAKSIHELIKYVLYGHYSRQEAAPFIDESSIEAIIEMSEFNNLWDT